MECTETVTLTLKKYHELLDEIKSKEVDNIELVRRSNEIISKNFKYTLSKGHEYNGIGLWTLHTNSHEIQSLYNETQELKKEIQELKQIKQTSILWGLIKFNKRK